MPCTPWLAAEDAYELASAMSELRESLAKPENLQLLTQHSRHALQLVLAINNLKENLATSTTLQLLAQNLTNAAHLTAAINDVSVATSVGILHIQ
ncbi:hypothetical protein [Piscirickettsia salmonis]|uniref:hypothetical protein n=1 Tax=Piscirickettsia salmonis TaxID=1238 RepID=UPI003A807343